MLSLSSFASLYDSTVIQVFFGTGFWNLIRDPYTNSLRVPRPEFYITPLFQKSARSQNKCLLVFQLLKAERNNGHKLFFGLAPFLNVQSFIELDPRSSISSPAIWKSSAYSIGDLNELHECNRNEVQKDNKNISR